MRVTVSDVVSPSYFPLTASVELGFFKAEGLDAEFIFPPVDPGRVLVDGDVDFYGASPYIAFECLSEWRGGTILCALSQYSANTAGRPTGSSRCARTWARSGAT
jgi:NitT/TauT family transport system substrate-binding protein